MRVLKSCLLYVFGVFFVLAGVNHFVRPDFYLKIMPPYLPWHLPLVYASGFCEALLGAMLLLPRFRPVAARVLIALLVAVSPANVHMALNPKLYPEIHPTLLWARLPLQLVLIAWAYRYAKSSKGGRDGGSAAPAGVSGL